MLTSHPTTVKRAKMTIKFSSTDIEPRNLMEVKDHSHDMNELTKYSVARLVLDPRSKSQLLPLLHRSLSYPPHIVDSWPHFLSNELERISHRVEDSHFSTKLSTSSPEYLVPRQRIVGGFHHPPSDEYVHVSLNSPDQRRRGFPPSVAECDAARKKPDHRSILVHASLQAAHRVEYVGHAQKCQVTHDSWDQGR